MQRYNKARLKNSLKILLQHDKNREGGFIHQQPYSKRKNKGSFNNSPILHGNETIIIIYIREIV